MHVHVPAALHTCPDAQSTQAAPPAPQLVFDWLAYGTHVFPLQQPLGQDVALQTHIPALLHV